MRVFISWSGKMSEQVATALRDWLPSVIQSIKPYVSSEDIEKGARWASDISQELEASDFGILCITPSNTAAPWLNFEAGALSKSMATSRVVPFLFKLDRASLPQGPLVQFQSVLATAQEVKKLVQSLNAACGDGAVEEQRLDQIFRGVVASSAEVSGGGRPEATEPAEGPRPDEDVLAEILRWSEVEQQILNSPERLIPLEYWKSRSRAAGVARALKVEISR